MITISYVFSGEISGMGAGGGTGCVEWKRAGVVEGVEDGATAERGVKCVAASVWRRGNAGRTRLAACLNESAERMIVSKGSGMWKE